MYESFRIGLFLLTLGVLKIIFNFAFGIEQPEYEYGLHWNVFITLAIIKVIISKKNSNHPLLIFCAFVRNSLILQLTSYCR